MKVGSAKENRAKQENSFKFDFHSASQFNTDHRKMK